MAYQLQRRPISRSKKPPVLHVVSINNQTNPVTKQQFVQEAMIDYYVRSKSVQGTLRLMGLLKGE